MRRVGGAFRQKFLTLEFENMYYLFNFKFLRLKPKFQVWKLFIYESLFYFSKSKPAYRIQNLAVQKVQDQIIIIKK